MTDFTDLADRYIAMWNETDARRRRDIIARLWADNASYVDPLMSGTGAAAIDDMVQGVQQRFPGHRFHRTSDVDAHNRCLRFAWELRPEAGKEPLVAGIDFGMVAADGRLQAITGFLDRVPAAA